MLVEASLIAVLNACFELTEEGPEEAQDRSVANLPKPYCFGVMSVGTSSPPLSVGMLRLSQPPHQDPC